MQEEEGSLKWPQHGLVCAGSYCAVEAITEANTETG